MKHIVLLTALAGAMQLQATPTLDVNLVETAPNAISLDFTVLNNPNPSFPLLWYLDGRRIDTNPNTTHLDYDKTIPFADWPPPFYATYGISHFVQAFGDNFEVDNHYTISLFSDAPGAGVQPTPDLGSTGSILALGTGVLGFLKRILA